MVLLNSVSLKAISNNLCTTFLPKKLKSILETAVLSCIKVLFIVDAHSLFCLMGQMASVVDMNRVMRTD